MFRRNLRPRSVNARLSWAPPVIALNSSGLKPFKYVVAADGSWSRYEINNDNTLTLQTTGTTSIYGVNNSSLLSDTNNYRDILIEAPSTINKMNGLTIEGFRNLVWIRGQISFPQLYLNGGVMPLPNGTKPGFDVAQRAMRIKRFTGTCHLEGLLIDGQYLYEGIDISSIYSGSVFQLQNCRIESVKWFSTGASGAGNDHDGGDAIQLFDGPSAVKIDRLTIRDSTYQALFFKPTDRTDGGDLLPVCDLRRIDITTTQTSSTSEYRNAFFAGTFSTGQTRFPITLSRCHAMRLPSIAPDFLRADLGSGNQIAKTTVYDGLQRLRTSWDSSALIDGCWLHTPPAEGFFCTRAGTSYLSPGYVN